MGHFIAVCPARPAQELIGSNRAELLDRVEFGPYPALRQHAARILAGDMPTGEQPDASSFITAWEKLCATAVEPFVCVEIYDSPDLFPEMFGFVWGGPEVPNAPVSTLGGAAVGLCTEVGAWIAKFESLDMDAVAERENDRYDEELAALVRVLRDPACAAEALIFWSE